MAIQFPSFINLFADVVGLQPGSQIDVGGTVKGQEIRALVEIADIGTPDGLFPIKVLKINGQPGSAFQLSERVYKAGEKAILFQNGTVGRLGVAFVREAAAKASARTCLTSGGVVVLLGLLAVGGLALYLSSRQSPDGSESWLASSVASVKKLLSSDEAQTAFQVASYLA